MEILTYVYYAVDAWDSTVAPCVAKGKSPDVFGPDCVQ
jgi:hypothetical protein